jgi:hypothetical protein
VGISRKSLLTIQHLSRKIGPGDAGEPLNVIISGLSSPEVLTDAGFLNFARALG